MAKALVRVLEVAFYVAFAVLAFCLCYTFTTWLPPLKDSVSSTIASWVQAVGAIGAIAGATWVSNGQYRRLRSDRLHYATNEAVACCNDVMRSIVEAITNISGIPVQLPLVSNLPTVRILHGIFADLLADMSRIAISDLDKNDAVIFARIKSILRKNSHSLAALELSSMQYTFDHIVVMLNGSKSAIEPLTRELVKNQIALDQDQ